MNTTQDQIKDIIRDHFHNRDWKRLRFTLMEVTHAWVNIPRERMRKVGFPESKITDWLARLLAAVPLVLLLMLVFSCPVLADDVVITWKPPTERVDGTPLTVDEIATFTLRKDGVVLSDTIANTDTSYTVRDLGVGTYCFDMATVDTEGRESPLSAAVCKPVKAAPNPPSVGASVVP